MRKGTAWATALLALPVCVLGQQTPPSAPAASPAPPAPQTQTPAMRITLDQAIRLALQHNHALQAARSTILQNQAQEITANLRPNPTLSWDAQFLPIFQPGKFNADYINNSAQFDLGIGYTLRARQEAPAPPAGRAGSNHCLALAGDRQRAQAHLQRRAAVRRRRCWRSPASTLPDRTSPASSKRSTSAKSSSRPAPSARATPQDQAADAAIPDRRFLGQALRRCRPSPRCGSSSASSPCRELRRRWHSSITSRSTPISTI